MYAHLGTHKLITNATQIGNDSGGSGRIVLRHTQAVYDIIGLLTCKREEACVVIDAKGKSAAAHLVGKGGAMLSGGFFMSINGAGSRPWNLP